jgi:hypothetical protein
MSDDESKEHATHNQSHAQKEGQHDAEIKVGGHRDGNGVEKDDHANKQQCDF